MAEGMNILEFRNVTKRYDTGVCALDGLTFAVPEGAIFGYIGLSGAGKTTTIRLLAGFLGNDSGDIRVFGRPLDPGAPDYKRSVGFVLDEPLYFEWMSAEEYLHFVGRMYGLESSEIGRRVPELLTFFDLEDRGEAPIETYSTGMKKKVSLAAAIIHKPRLVVLDEPLEGIDAVAASAIKETLALMASRGTTILITSHVLDTIERFCTEIAIVHHGTIVLQCRTSEIRTRARRSLPDRTFESLEELFVETVSDTLKKRLLTWL